MGFASLSSTNGYLPGPAKAKGKSSKKKPAVKRVKKTLNKATSSKK